MGVIVGGKHYVKPLGMMKDDDTLVKRTVEKGIRRVFSKNALYPFITKNTLLYNS